MELGRTLASIPGRHPLLVLGDFNVKLPRRLPAIPCKDPCGHLSFDSEDVLALLTQYDLVMRNERAGCAGITYQSSNSATPPRTGSRIDYCFIRRSMRSCSSLTKVCWDTPFLTPNAFGWHATLVGRLSMRWRSWRKGTPQKRSKIIDKELISAALSREHPMHQSFTALLQQKLANRDDLSFQHLQRTVLECSLAVFGVDPSPRPLPHWMSKNVRDLCLAKWRSYHAVRSIQGNCSLRTLFQSWKAVVRMLLDGRSYKMACKKARACWAHSVCEEASAKASVNDPRFYSLVRKLSPKRPTRIPGVNKMLAGASDLRSEGRLLCSYFSDLFGSSESLPHLEPETWSWTDSCPPSADVLAEFLSGLPPHKAVPRDHAIGAAWRLALHLPLVRSCIYDMVVRFPSTGVTQSFRDGSLLLIPKTGKSGKLIEHYRPLVLQCPLGKMLLRWFVAKLTQQIKARILATPQFAFLTGRSTHMAIHRIVSFIEHRKTLAKNSQLPPHLLKAGVVPLSCSGFLVISLDLKQAFDRVLRPKLMTYLEKMEISEDLCGLLRSWHLDTYYYLAHGKDIYEILSTRGVRQGCTAAPVLWLVYLFNIMQGLWDLEDVDWYELVTAFADDLIFTFAIDTLEDITPILSRVRKLLAYLSGHGLEVNYDKTQVMFKLFGSLTSRHWRHHTYYKGGKRYLKLMDGYHPILTDSLEYLGVRLSWRNCGDSVLAHRMQKSCGVFALLRPWWRTPMMTTSLKTRIYRTMVLPVLLYGLGSSGTSPKGEIRLRKLILRQLRCIYKSPVHLTRESDDDFLRRIGFLTPSLLVGVECCRVARQLLPECNPSAFVHGKGIEYALSVHIKCCTSWLRSVHAGLCALLPDVAVPPLCDLDVPQLRALLAGIPRRHLQQDWLVKRPRRQAAPVGSSASHVVPPSSGQVWQCQGCGREFVSYNQLRSHQYKLTCGWDKKELTTFLPAVDARTELPSCHWCGLKFLRWHGVKQHVSLGQCPAKHLRDEFLALKSRPLPYHLDQDLSHHCVLCRRWFRFPRSLSYHLKAVHKDEYLAGHRAYASLDLTPALTQLTCIACGYVPTSCNRMYHLRGRCMVILQRCMAQVPNPLASSEYLAGEEVSWETAKEQQPEHHEQQAQLEQQAEHVATDDYSLGCRSLRSNGCSASRCLGRSSGRPDQQETSLSKSFLQSCSQIRTGEGERQGKGKEQRDTEEGGCKLSRQESGGRRRRDSRPTCVETGPTTTRTTLSHIEVDKPGGTPQSRWEKHCRSDVGSEHQVETVLGRRRQIHHRTVAGSLVQDSDVLSCLAAYRVVKRIRGKRSISLCVERGSVLLRTAVGSRSRTVGHGAWGSYPHIRCDESDPSRASQTCFPYIGGTSESAAPHGEVTRDSDATTPSYLFGCDKRRHAPPCTDATACTHDLLGTHQRELARGEGACTTLSRPAPQEALSSLTRCTSFHAEQVGLHGCDLPLLGCRLLCGGLVNEHNVCYANSLLACLTSVASHCPQLVRTLPHAVKSALQALLSEVPPYEQDLSQPAHLVRDFPDLFTNWPVGEHEDAYEFFQHVLGSTEIPLLRHCIQITRWHVSGREVTERQQQHVFTLCFDLQDVAENSASHSLRSLYATWCNLRHEDGEWHCSQHTLDSCSRVMVFHLQRFAMIAGMVRKIRQAVSLDNSMCVTLASGQSVTFQLVAALVHHGIEATSGHYSAYVLADAGAGYFRCNDVRVSRKGCTISDLDSEIARDAYMIFMVRRPDSRGETEVVVD